MSMTVQGKRFVAALIILMFTVLLPYTPMGILFVPAMIAVVVLSYPTIRAFIDYTCGTNE